MNQLKKLLEPGFIKDVCIKNRVSMAPMERGYGAMDGSVTQQYIDYLVERAKNGVGLIFTESTYVDPMGRGRLYQLGLYDDKLVQSHKRLTDAVHRYGAKIGAEIQHAGRQTSAAVSGFQPVGPSAVPCDAVGGDIPRELTVGEIREIVDKFAQASRRAKDAGYDMIAIHGAHGYLVDAFASPFSNKRNDEYGGTLEKRMRFPFEVYNAVSAAVGEDYPVGYRISADEFVDGGLLLDDTKIMAKMLEEAGIDFLDVSAGIYESVQMITGPSEMPLGYLVNLAAEMKEVVKIPVITTGRINDMIFAESILENNHADFVHMVRAFHADPEILIKSQEGQMDSVCMCIGCNRCSDTLVMHVPTVCTVNPSAGREREFYLKPAKTKKRVLVIGGGIAGMEAARIAQMRGHEVTLIEKDEELGGQIRWASKDRHSEEFFQTARYRIHELYGIDVPLKMGKEVTITDVKGFKPDVVIVATGAIPFIPQITGIEKGLVATSFDILSGKREIGKRSVVIGGTREGLSVAEYIAENGGEVIIVEVSDSLGSDISRNRQVLILGRITENSAISIKLKATVEQIEDNGVKIKVEGQDERVDGIDSVVLAWKRESVNRLYFELVGQDLVPEIYRIGDAVMPRDAYDAIFEGATIGRRI